MKHYIVTAPNGAQYVVYQARDGSIRVERIHPVEPPPSRIWGPEF